VNEPIGALGSFFDFLLMSAHLVSGRSAFLTDTECHGEWRLDNACHGSKRPDTAVKALNIAAKDFIASTF